MAPPARPVFVVCGYGVPADILADGNYDRYLRAVFNAVYDRSASVPPVIVFSGGPTDVRPPYGRTEAGEMARAFRALMEREPVGARTAAWTVLLEERALSTLDNLLLTRTLLSRRRVGPVTVCGEHTRAARLRTLGRSVFGRGTRLLAFDFDHSANRYLDRAFLRKKERYALAVDRWGLANRANLRRHRALHAERLTRLREAAPGDQVKAVQAWWAQALRSAVPAGLPRRPGPR